MSAAIRARQRHRLGAPLVAAAAAAIAVADVVAWQLAPGIGAWGVFDETAHAATGLLALAAVTRYVKRSTALAVLAGSLLIDLDHLPSLFGSQALTKGTPRPYSHSLLTVLIVVGISLLARSDLRRLGLVFAAALSLHFFRDLAEPGGPGVALAWPVSHIAFRLSYAWYGAAMALLTVTALASRRRR